MVMFGTRPILSTHTTTKNPAAVAVAAAKRKSTVDYRFLSSHHRVHFYSIHIHALQTRTVRQCVESIESSSRFCQGFFLGGVCFCSAIHLGGGGGVGGLGGGGGVKTQLCKGELCRQDCLTLTQRPIHDVYESEEVLDLCAGSL